MAADIPYLHLGQQESSLQVPSKSLLKKTAKITVYEYSDAAEFAQNYIVDALKALGLTATTEVEYEEDVIKISINSDKNPVLIGKAGNTLQSLNELVKLAVSNKFRHRFRILLDVAGYKEDKYSRNNGTNGM